MTQRDAEQRFEENVANISITVYDRSPVKGHFFIFIFIFRPFTMKVSVSQKRSTRKNHLDFNTFFLFSITVKNVVFENLNS